MRFPLTAEVLVLAKNERTGSNGNAYYNLAILKDGEAGNISCTKELFESITEGTKAVLEAVYNDQYKSLQFNRVLDSASSGAGAGPQPKAAKQQ